MITKPVTRAVLEHTVTKRVEQFFNEKYNSCNFQTDEEKENMKSAFGKAYYDYYDKYYKLHGINFEGKFPLCIPVKAEGPEGSLRRDPTNYVGSETQINDGRIEYKYDWPSASEQEKKMFESQESFFKETAGEKMFLSMKKFYKRYLEAKKSNAAGIHQKSRSFRGAYSKVQEAVKEINGEWTTWREALKDVPFFSILDEKYVVFSGDKQGNDADDNVMTKPLTNETEHQLDVVELKLERRLAGLETSTTNLAATGFVLISMIGFFIARRFCLKRRSVETETNESVV